MDRRVEGLKGTLTTEAEGNQKNLGQIQKNLEDLNESSPVDFGQIVSKLCKEMQNIRDRVASPTPFAVADTALVLARLASALSSAVISLDRICTV